MNNFFMDEIDEKINNLCHIVNFIYCHLVPEWQRHLDARRLADTMAKKNRKKTKSVAHHKVAGELIIPSKIRKNWRHATPPKVLVPKNTPERMKRADWVKFRTDVKVSIARFEEKLLHVARKRVEAQLENLNI
mgnify:CR=1 FL=1